jgi:hypothetical protein
MQVANVAENFMVSLPFIALAEAAVALVIWLLAGGKGGRWAGVAAWIGLTSLMLWCGSMIAFVVLHGLLFFIGPGAAVAGVVVTTILMLAMPFGCAYVIRHRAPREGQS